ncbi:hypothetical protein Q5N41_17780 [Vibrio cholerae]|uniref:hypothetical protein n=1 Tax=Vibrio cholerae TaxID=666 RepID=UPI000E0B71A7|nr:hypothetical protein [Vibrio cholerae]EGR1102575.1 hypothetical protein [Vibrio cholerae]EGR4455523.1 hypothetical protein [Vibrio cholerae]ELH0879140.1 hypothetical protein [Vibrio cholerae]ELL7182982.1 hypothetical protein [Vibrio cholerae]ELY5216490.1 hypothetical protein [Vibrio cholerae]
MSFIERLLEEIESEPCSKLCTVCFGRKTVTSFSWSRFITKYGADSLDYDSKFSIAERAWREANAPEFLAFKVVFLDMGLTHSEAKDFYELYLTQNAVEQCRHCENGRELTEHGERVARLRNALNNL